jgi:rod shape-determining protein MreD
MIISILVITLFINSIFTNLIGLNSILTPLFPLVILVAIYPYIKNKNKYYFICLIYGLIYDLIFGKILFINSFLFLLLSFFVDFINRIWNNNIVSSNIFTCLIIILYRVLYYIMLIIMNKASISITLLFKSIYCSILSNLFFISIMYLLLDYISHKFKLYKDA